MTLELTSISRLTSRLTSRLESKHFLILGKILITIILLGIIFSWTLFLIVVLPMLYVIMNHGQSKKQSPINLSIAMIPAAICGLLIWRIWYPKWNPDLTQISSQIPTRFRRWLPAPEMKRTGR